MRYLLILVLLTLPVLAQRSVDGQGRVTTGDTAMDAILGPMLADTVGQWTWYDNRGKAAAAVHAADMASTYLNGSSLPYWDVADTGTITVATGSDVVTGSGTAFTTKFCQGPGSPTVKKSSATIIVWYPVGESTGRKEIPITSCTDNTHLTMRNAWADVADGSGLSYTYSDDTVSGAWLYGESPQNYYDNVMALYSLYYRTGTAGYLTQARALADLWWRQPRMDRGVTCGAGNTINADYCQPPRSHSLAGLYLRALDGATDMWPGLRLMAGNYMWYLANYDKTYGSIWDLREEAYHLAGVSYCALADPTLAATCKAAISASFADIWTAHIQADGGWHSLYSTLRSWEPITTSVTLTHGSATVVGVDTTWAEADILAQPLIWFTNASTKPVSNADGDAAWYTATWVSGTGLTLDRPYEGTSGSHGWLTSADSTIAKALGWGQQPFMMGLAAMAFDYARQAIATSDPTTSALAATYRDSAVTWLKTYGYRSATKGLYYFAQYVNCQKPISEANTACTAEGDVNSRDLSSEIMRGVSASYAGTGDAALKTWGDALMSAMYSNAEGQPAYDGYWSTELGDAGWYMTGDPVGHNHPKWFGSFFGFGGSYTWPAARLGEAEAGGGGTYSSGSLAQAGSITILP
jgi:hypothetical protein